MFLHRNLSHLNSNSIEEGILFLFTVVLNVGASKQVWSFKYYVEQFPKYFLKLKFYDYYFKITAKKLDSFVGTPFDTASFKISKVSGQIVLEINIEK